MSVVAVTGAAGFVGRHVVAHLAREGRRAVAIDLPEPLAAFDAGLEASLGPARALVAPIAASVTDAAAMRSALDGADGLIHCAAIADLWIPDPSQYDAVNVGGTRTTLAAASAAGVRRATHVSSFVTLISGPRAEPETPLDERTELSPDDLFGPYPASKRRSELVAETAVADGLSVSIALPSAPIGPGDVNLTPPARLLRDLAAGALPAMLDCLMNLVDVRALAAGIVSALDHGRPGRRYLLSGEDLEMRDLATMVARIAGARAPKATAPAAAALAAAHVEAWAGARFGRRPTAPLSGVRLALRRRRFDATRAREELGFAPGSIEPAIVDAVAWMRAEGLIPESRRA